MLPLVDRPFVQHIIEFLVAGGIKRLDFVLGHLPDEVEARFGDGSRWGIRLTYIEQEAPLGLAHAVMISEDFLGKEPFVMYLGDNILKSGIKSLVEEFQEEKPNSLILLTEVPNAQMFGVAMPGMGQGAAPGGAQQSWQPPAIKRRKLNETEEN